jgi:hypothetical protein
MLPLVVACVLVATPSPAQSPNSADKDLEKKLALRVPAGRVEGTFVGALGELARSFDLPMGIAWVKTSSSQRERSIQYADTTVLGIIESIASTEPSYEVFVSRGVVHVETGEIPLAQNFLYLRVPEFSMKSSANFVQNALWMRLNQIISPDPRRGYGGSIFTSASERRLDLSFENATVEEILDSIAASSDYKTWVVTFDEHPDLTLSGFRRTETRLSEMPPPDASQPVWEHFMLNSWPLHLAPR